MSRTEPFVRLFFPVLASVMVLPLVLWVSTIRADDYVVVIDGSDSRLALVTATVEPVDGEIGMNEEGVHGLENGWATFVENIKVTGADGTVFAVDALPDSRWRLDGYQDGPVTLSYNVRLGHDQVNIKFGDNGAAYANDTGVMWAGRALFIAGKPAINIPIRFNVPENWRVTTAWETRGDDAGAFNVLTTDDLLNSAIFAGTHEQFDLVAGQVTLRMALSGENTLGMKEMITDMTGQYLDHYEGRFRSPTRASMILVAADRSYWGGEVMGRAISLSIGGKPPPGFNPLEALSHVMAHEIFHVFSLIRMAISEESTDFQWFTEGFGAEYAAWLARLRLGQIDETAFLADLSTQYDKYMAKVDGELTLVSAGTEKAANYDVVYSGGYVASIALDFLIRKESNGSQSLDDLWTRLLNKYPRGGEPLTLSKLANEARDLFGESTGAAFERYFSSPDAIPLYANAELMGLARHDGILAPAEGRSEGQQKLWQGFLVK
jgi:predicted metalloprotease with PDZ domain